MSKQIKKSSSPAPVASPTPVVSPLPVVSPTPVASPMPVASPTPVAAPPAAGPAQTVVAMPPKPGAPTPPAGFVPLDKADSLALTKPTPTQVAGGMAVVGEINASTTWTADFSTAAPAAADFANAITVASAWTNEFARSEQWQKFASAEKQTAWDAVMKMTEELQTEYDYAAGHDATIAVRYPELTRFLEGKHAVAQKANQTKSANAKAAAKAAPAAPAPAPAAAAKA